MKRTFRIILWLACATLTGSVHAQTKTGVVDLKKVFDGYWRTKQADAQLKERAADLDKARTGLIDDFKKAGEEFRKMIEAANDPAVSADEREKRKKDLEKRQADLREQENGIRTFDQSSSEQLSGQRLRMRESILRDIRGILDEKAKAGGYNLVIDVAATSINQTPFIMYTTLTGTDVDLTDGILKQLNANQPPEGTKAADPVKTDDKDAAKPTDKK